MIRFYFIFILILGKDPLYGQGSAGFFDDRQFFFTYMNGAISKQEILRIDTFFTSTNYVSYIDRNGNFKLIVDHKKYTIYPVPPDSVKISNFLMAYTRGGQLGVFNGKQSKKVETFISGGFKLGDSVLAYLDNFEVLKVYLYDTIVELQPFSTPDMFQVGDNIVAFRTRDERLQAYYDKKVYPIEAYIPADYKIARDMIVYHDNLDYFKVFEKGQTFTLENYHIDDFHLTNNLLTYFSNAGEWIAYEDGHKTVLLTNSPKMKLQKRNMLAFADRAGNFYGFYKGKLFQLENYTPVHIEIWDDMIVYSDFYNVIWGLVHGQKIKLSEGIVLNWSLQNRAVVYYDLTPNTKSVWNNGKIYRYSSDYDPSKN